MSHPIPFVRRRPSRRPLAIAALIAVPLAVVGIFAGALSAVGTEDGRIPAAIVNNDELVEQTAADGTTTSVVAGRLLVTELTGSESSSGAAATAFDWIITGEAEAEEALENGEVYAVITIPENFSASIVSLGSETPEQANLTLITDDAHGYITGPITDALGDGLAALFGTELSKQYISGLVGGTVQLGEQLGEAADGARSLQTGAQQLGSGLTEATAQTGTAADGADELASGVRAYTDGVSSLSAGLGQLNSAAAGLDQLPAGIDTYASNIPTAAGGIRQILAADPTINPETAAALEQVAGGLDQLYQGRLELTGQVQSAVDGVQSGISQSASGASQLAGSGPALVSGTENLATGLDQLTTGLGQSADGANQLGDGAGQLADGLTSGAEQIPVYTDDQIDEISGVAADPVSLSTARDNEVTSVPQIVSTLLVPTGLWIGAIAVFLALGTPTRRVLVTVASTGRVAGRIIGRAALIGAAQAVLLVALLHTAVGVPWSSLGATLPFALVIAVAFAAIHAMLTAVFGRWGLVISLVLLALQLISTGGLYPIELVSAPFRAISPLLPLTGAVNGMQAIVTGSGAGEVVSGILTLVIWAVISAIVTLIAVGKRRTARALRLVPTVTPATA